MVKKEGVVRHAMKIAKAIHYADNPQEIHNPYLFIQAITHRSYSSEHPDAEDNELLEFIGDEVLDASITRLLLSETSGFLEDDDTYYLSDYDEGDLTSLKQILVSGQNLSKVAKELKLGQFLLLGKSAESQGVRNNDRILENLVEALIGAVALDTAFDRNGAFDINNINHSKVDKVVSSILHFEQFIQQYHLDDIDNNDFILTQEDLDNPKNALNKLYTKGIIDQPQYGVVDYGIDQSTGKVVWRCYCRVKEIYYVSKIYYTRKNYAEAEAASYVLNKITLNCSQNQPSASTFSQKSSSSKHEPSGLAFDIVPELFEIGRR